MKSRYVGQFQWFERKLTDSLLDVEMSIVDVEGEEFDPGMAATPINLDEFESNDVLEVDRMLEPIIMGSKGVVRTGKVVLRRKLT